MMMKTINKEIVRIDSDTDAGQTSYRECFIYSKNETTPVLSAISFNDCIFMNVDAHALSGMSGCSKIEKYNKAEKAKLIQQWRGTNG